MLRSLGLAPQGEYGPLEGVVREQLTERGHHAEIGSLRYGVLTLRADNPAAARRLMYDVDVLCEVIHKRLPDLDVRRITVHSRAA